jgi:putative tryptophan/tyrosine transport system substrate-binding protein
MGTIMRRRELITGLAAALLPVGTLAQPSAAKKRIAVIGLAKVAVLRIGGDPNATVFFEELKRLGYIEGDNLVVDRYEMRPESFADTAREVVGTQPDVIVCYTAAAAHQLKASTGTIPIVAITGDPISFGLISSLSHPGGNITGVSVDAGVEIWGKRLELLAQAVPKLANVLFVSTRGGWEAAGGRAVRQAAQKLGLSLVSAIVNSPYNEAEYRRTLSAIQPDRPDGITLSDEGVHFKNRFLLVQLLQQVRIPAIYTYREQVEAGGLMAYACDLKSAIRTQVRQVVEVLHGANPGDMPYFQADRFELVINLKTANELGLEMPAGLVAGAVAVIE